MTHATIYKNSNGDILGCRLEGHAGFADEGEDIVCAAISILVINTCNSIDTFTEDRCIFAEMNEDSGVIDFTLESSIKNLEISKDVRVLLNAMQLGLSQIAAQYPKHLTITIEEV